MNPLTLFATVALAHLLAVMSPGPDFAMVSRQTLAYGRGAGIATALGIGSGIGFHVAWAMFGMGWVITRWPVLLELLRYGGALFLLYMGVQALRTQAAPAASNGDDRAEAGSRWRHYRVGVLTNVLNPKVLLFFMALCSAVITVSTPIWLRLALGLWMAASTAAWFSLVSFTLGHPGIRRRLLASAHWIDRVMGVVLVALGAGMIVTSITR